MLPPGLYEATFERKSSDTKNPDLVSGEWVMRCEPRTLDDIRAMGGNSPEEERRFATAARISEINLSLYRAFVQPMVKGFVTPPMVEWLKRWHPVRDVVPGIHGCQSIHAGGGKRCRKVRENRKPAAADNPFLSAQEQISQQVVKSLDTWREVQEKLSEQMFLCNLWIAGTPGCRWR